MKRERDFILALAACVLLALLSGCEPDLLPCEEQDFGKLRITNQTDLRFNVYLDGDFLDVWEVWESRFVPGINTDAGNRVLRVENEFFDSSKTIFVEACENNEHFF